LAAKFEAAEVKQLSLKEIQDKYAAGAAVSSAVLRKLQRDPRTGARRLYRVLAKRYDEQKRERNRLDAMLHFERLLWKAGIQHIAGVDEVGVGPLAGPVVAAAVVFPQAPSLKASMIPRRWMRKPAFGWTWRYGERRRR
jgi:ribonuclease HII